MSESESEPLLTGAEIRTAITIFIVLAIVAGIASIPPSDTNASIYNAKHLGDIVSGVAQGGKWVVEIIGKTLGGTLKAADLLKIGDNVTPVVVFALSVFLFIMWIFNSDALFPEKKSKNVKKPKKGPFSSFRLPSYKIKLFSFNFGVNGGAAKNSIISRPTIKGRCDNFRNYEITSKGICLNTSAPAPILWTLDVKKMPELEELSEATKRKVDGGEEAGKYTVTIPWAEYKSDGLHYYPDCRKAVFVNGSSAAYHFTDKDTRTCVRKSVPRAKHTGRVRSTTSKALDSYIVPKK